MTTFLPKRKISKYVDFMNFKPYCHRYRHFKDKIM